MTTRREFLMGTAAGVAAAAAMAGCAPEARREAIPAPRRTLGPNDRIGVGFIGCGGRAGAHMGCIRYLRDEQKAAVEPVAVCDIYRPRMERAKLKLGVEHGYMDHRDLLADPRVDVVCIATPDHHHCHQAIDAVRAGKDVYCEKPVSHWRQFALVKRLVEEVKASGRVFQLGSQGMSDSAWRQMRKLIADGLIGRPIHADCGYFRVGDWGERGMPIDDPRAQPGPNLNWEAFLGDSPKRPFDVSRFFRWRMYEDYAGGPVTDLFPHSFTPVAYMLGVTFPSLVVATGGMFRYTEREVPDTFNMLIDYPQKITVAVLGTQGNNDPTIPGRGAGQRVPTLRGWDGSLTVAGKEIIFAPAQGSKKQAQRFPVEQGENLGDHWKNLLDAVRAGRPGDTWSPADLAYYVQTPLIMGMLALRQGKVATFDAAKEQILL